MKKTMTIIYGPPMSGKTQNSERLRSHYRCARVLDDWTEGRGFPGGVKPQRADLILTYEPRETCARHFPTARIVSITNALRAIGGAA